MYHGDTVTQKEIEAAGVNLPPRHKDTKRRLRLWRRPAIGLLVLLGSSASAQGASEFADYPVPVHILQWSDTLGLSEEQIKQIEAISDARNATAQALGIRIIAREEQLQELLLAGDAPVERTDSLTAALVRLRGEMRSLSRTANMHANEILTMPQRALYGALRNRNRGSRTP
jgi:Spy/CpxP family protein refolding chaperone